jgi:hypothetical protein
MTTVTGRTRIKKDMMDFISFLNVNAGAVQSTFAGIVAAATAIYVFYTARMFGRCGTRISY